MSKIGLSILVAGVAGIIAGIIFFLLRKTPSPETCKNSGPLKREFLLNAVLVSSLLSCLVFFCSTKLSAQDKQENATEQKTAAANDIKKIIESKEWQELKVFWNLITAKNEALEKRGNIPYWKRTVLYAITDYKIKKLDCLVAEGAMAQETQKALNRIVKDMISHICRLNLGATCYLMDNEGVQRMGNLDKLLAQSIFLQGQFEEDHLEPDVLRKTSEEILSSLEALELLEKDFENSQHGKKSLTTKDRPETVSRKVIDLIVDLNEYKFDSKREKSLRKEINGNRTIEILREFLKGANGYDKVAIAEALGSIGGKEVIPILQDLYKDEFLDDQCGAFVHYPVRNAAGVSLVKRGISANETSTQNADSPEGRKMILKALASEAYQDFSGVISGAGQTKDKSMIPILLSFAGKHPDMTGSVIEAVGELGGSESVPTIISLYENDNKRAFSSLAETLGKTASKEVASSYLKKEFENSKQSAAKIVFMNALLKVKTDGIENILAAAFKDTDDQVRLAAAIEFIRSKTDNKEAEDFLDKLIASGDNAVVYNLMDKLLMIRPRPQKTRELIERCEVKLDLGKKEVSFQEFKKVMEGDGLDSKLDVILSLKVITSPEMEDLLIKELEKGNDNLNSHIAEVLGAYGSDRSIDPLLKLFYTRKFNHRKGKIYGTSKTDLIAHNCENAINRLLKRNAKRVLGIPIGGQSDFSRDVKIPGNIQEKLKTVTSLSKDEILSLIVLCGEGLVERDEKEKIYAELTKDPGRFAEAILSYFSRIPIDNEVFDWEFWNLNSSDKLSDSSGFPGYWDLDLCLMKNIKGSLPEIIEFLRDNSKYGREEILNIFDKDCFKNDFVDIKNIQGLSETIKQLCSDSNPRVRGKALKLFARSSDSSAEVLEFIAKGLLDDASPVQHYAYLAIDGLNYGAENGAVKKIIVTALLKAIERKIESTDDSFIGVNCFMLAKLKDKSAIPVLEKIINMGYADKTDVGSSYQHNPVYSPSQQAAKTLFLLGGAEEVPFWREVAGNVDEDDIVQLWGMASLLREGIEPEIQIKKINGILTDASSEDISSDVRDEIYKVLGDLGGKELVK